MGSQQCQYYGGSTVCFSSHCALGLGITNPWLPCSDYNESTTSYEINFYLLATIIETTMKWRNCVHGYTFLH